MFNKQKFKSRVIELGLDMGDVSKSLNINIVTLYRKINGTSDFTRNEIQRLMGLLHLDIENTEHIFFAEKLTYMQEK